MSELTLIDDNQLSNLLGMNVEITTTSGKTFNGNIYSFHRSANFLICK